MIPVPGGSAGILPEALVLLPPLLGAAAAVDVYRRKIPNVISLGGAILGLALWMQHDGISGVAAGLTGWLVGAALFFPFYVLKGMGAGDIKLMGAVGVFLGALDVLLAGIVIALVGGSIAASVAISQRRLGAALRDSLSILIGRTPHARLGATASSSDAIPYGLAIAAGTLLYMIVVRFVA